MPLLHVCMMVFWSILFLMVSPLFDVNDRTFVQYLNLATAADVVVVGDAYVVTVVVFAMVLFSLYC